MTRASEPLRKSISRGHELRDVRMRVMVYFILSLLVLTVLAMLGIKWLTADYAAGARAGERPRHPLADTLPMFPPPRLQVDAAGDLERMQAAEDQLLDSYGWVDRGAGVVRIPLDEAMAAVADEGLPALAPGEDEDPR